MRECLEISSVNSQTKISASEPFPIQGLLTFVVFIDLHEKYDYVMVSQASWPARVSVVAKTLML